MCCFSRPAQVAETNIFARSSENGRQYLVYSMKVKAREELAMLLPLPVPVHSAEDAIRWISLKAYPTFFQDMTAGIFEPSRGGRSGRAARGARAPLAVVEVGDFEASFVPTLPDFDRLDARFKLPTEVWDHLPQYHDYGFAVFKLKPEAKDFRTIHPMAFEFPRADPKRLFFPTVHIHDGRVHASARFDHGLFCQEGPKEEFHLAAWEESVRPAGQFMKSELCAGLVAPDLRCRFLVLQGQYKNEDVWLG